MTDQLTRATVQAAIHVPAELLAAGAVAVANRPRWSPKSQDLLVTANPAANYREHARAIGHAWSHTPDVSGAAVAAAMRAAAKTAKAVRTEYSTSLVWTGPTTEALGLRSTRSVLNALVANATESLILVSFATHNVGDLTTDLSNAAARGVEVTIILETPDDPGGPLDIGPTHPLAPLRGTATFYRWPDETRRAHFATTARLHAKCVIADRTSALITSANLTSAGINDNIELGIFIEAGPLPGQLAHHIRLLIEQGTLDVS
ncbi:MAG: DISARM system phospholipase D-like protein DrmC [bacterium]|nr:DISARM system phospholipase D-like protein DrmC [bacterium]MDE0351660.1 DISARM system phospholipase D-like protein DrmC [bacterium]